MVLNTKLKLVMTKKEIVDKVSKQTGIDREDVYLLFESFIKTIQDSMVDGKNIYIRGFGSFINKKIWNFKINRRGFIHSHSFWKKKVSRF